MNAIMEWNDFWAPILLSLKVVLLSSVIVFVAAVLAAWRLARRNYRGNTLVEAFLLLPLVLPPTVVGFVLLVVLGHHSWVGMAAEWLFHHSIVFTYSAAVIASAVVAFPLVYQTVKVGFAAVDQQFVEAAHISGAKEWQVLWYIVLPLSMRSLWAGYILGFARGLGEFGATLMVAGNIPGKTQTISTAIYIAVNSGKMTLAWVWVGAMILISLAMLWIVNKREQIN